MIVTLQEARKQLEIEDGFTADDAEITRLIKVAEFQVADETGLELSLLEEESESVVERFKQAVLLLMTTFKMFKGSQDTVEMKQNPAYVRLVGSIRKY